MNRKSLIFILTLTLAAALLFAAKPELDLAVARWFYDVDHFVGRGALAEGARWFGWYLPFVILIGFALAYAARLLGWLDRAKAPGARAMVLLLLTMALGPGLLVNVGLKDHSHRPRPVQVQEFGGKFAFRPYYRFDGACKQNCSFVSGEVSSAFWTLIPASLAPPALKPVAMAAALVFGVAVGVLRMAFGGHFLSDVIFAGLFMLLIGAAVNALLPKGRR